MIYIYIYLEAEFCMVYIEFIFSYTLFRVKCALLAVILVVILARVGKKPPFIEKHLVPMSAFGHDLVPLVQFLHRVGEGDMELLHEAEVADTVSTEKSSDCQIIF